MSSNKSSKTVHWEFIWKIHLVPKELCVIILENFVKCLQWQQQYNHCEDQKKNEKKVSFNIVNNAASSNEGILYH